MINNKKKYSGKIYNNKCFGTYVRKMQKSTTVPPHQKDTEISNYLKQDLIS